MPYTLYCKATDIQPVKVVGVFESTVLADRHGRRNLRYRPFQVLEITEPLLPENYLSVERMSNACNFALTCLNDPQKAEDENYLAKCIEEVKAALNDTPPPEPTSWEWEIVMRGTDNIQRSAGTTEEMALTNLGFTLSIARNWRDKCKSIRRVREIAA